jgi:hypothetical protein
MSYGPSLSYIYVGGDGWIFAQFDQPIYFDGSTLDGFTIMVNGSPVNVDNSYIWGAGGDNRLSFGTIPPIQSGDSVEISYSGSDLHNLSGDDVQSFSESPVMNMSYLSFSRGTLIITIFWDVAVEDMRIGQMILNYDDKPIPIKWIGKQRFNPRFGKDNLPICISAGALGNGLPVRDLYVSPDHAMYLDDCMLVHAKALVNGNTIYQVTEWEGDIEYFHIETENHEIILAEGAPTETFIDNVSRKSFYNHAEYEAKYPDAQPMLEVDIPRVKYARQLPMATRHRLVAVSNEKVISLA